MEFIGMSLGTYSFQIPLQQIAIAAGAALVDGHLFHRATNIAAAALFTLVGSLMGGALLDALDEGECDGIVAASASILINTIAAIILGIVCSVKEAAEYFLITLSLGTIVAATRLALFSKEPEKTQRSKCE